MRNLLANSFKACLLILLIIMSTKSNAQCPDPRRCTSKDLSIVGAFLTGGQCFCSSTGTQTANLNMSINNTTGSVRTSFAFFGTLVKTDPDGTRHTSSLSGCGGALPPNTTTTILVVTGITYNCTQTLSLENVFLAWTDAAGNTTDRCAEILADACVHISPKCGTAPVIPIAPLLSFQATDVSACSGSSDGSLIVKPIGGKAPFSVTVGNTTVPGVTAGSSATFTGLGAGSYNVRVTDAQPCTYTSTGTVTAHFCCSAPTQGNNPSPYTVCDGFSATFSATATGGSPQPTVQWEEKVGNGNFAPISNGGVYSGATTGTLTISDAHGKNGNQYRAVFTSAGCAPFTSGAATLTVNGLPPAPNGVPQPITDPCSTSTYCVVINNVVANATYRIRDAEGHTFDANTVTITPSDAVHSTSTANITFCGIPAGGGFSLTVVGDNGCVPTAGAVPCPASTNRTQKTSTTTIELNDAQTSVKAYPNPFSDRVKFLVKSSVAGRGSLEVYNMMGQKIKTVYQGFINSGTQTFELSLPRQQIANLVYVLRVGDKKMSGKLLQINQ